ncbi:MAG: hypothetical protein R3E53_00685 [Myxococcota bacterium]
MKLPMSTVHEWSGRRDDVALHVTATAEGRDQYLIDPLYRLLEVPLQQSVELEILASRDAKRAVVDEVLRQLVHGQILLGSHLAGGDPGPNHEGGLASRPGQPRNGPRIAIFLLVDPVELRHPLIQLGEPGIAVLEGFTKAAAKVTTRVLRVFDGRGSALPFEHEWRRVGRRGASSSCLRARIPLVDHQRLIPRCAHLVAYMPAPVNIHPPCIFFSERISGRKETVGVHETTPPPDATEAIRQRCVDAALCGYEEAMSSGLCREGAWEVAVDAIRRVDLSGLAGDSTAIDRPSGGETSDRDLMQLSIDLAGRFSSPGPPAAGNGAAVTGAIAAGLLQRAAGHAEEHGAEAHRPRARRIRRRAAILSSALAAAARQDVVGNLLDTHERDGSRRSRARAAESVLEIATRCSQIAALAAEIAPHARGAFRLDVDVALRLSWSASQSAIDLFEANLPPDDEGSEWLREERRRAWRVRLLLRRASAGIRPSGSD